MQYLVWPDSLTVILESDMSRRKGMYDLQCLPERERRCPRPIMTLRAGGSPRRSRGLRGSLQQRHFYEEADPDRALAMLEDEMSLDMEEQVEAAGTRTDSSLRTARGLAKLRELLEKECEAQVRLI